MKLKFYCAFTFLISLFTFHVQAQQPVKVAVFAPIYTDSAFDGNNYKLGNNNLPKAILPGLEFYNGVMLAVDSLNAEGKSVEVLFYDSKGSESIYTIIRKPEFQNVSMIIACFNNRNDIKPLADIALNRSIPLISATYPNDGGILENSYFVMLNTALNTHIEEIHKYIQRNYATNNIVYVKRKGALEDLVFSIFSSSNKKTAALPLKFKTIELNDNFTNEDLNSQLDSVKSNLVICGSLNETFGVNIVKSISSNKNYSATVVGMPTWDGLKELDKSDCNGVTLVYTTSYNFPRNLPVITNISQAYKNKLFARPSDMVLKGYESMYHFTSLLIEHPKDVIDYLSEKKFKIANDFIIQPKLSVSGNEMKVNYLENKKIYFIKKLDGIYK